MSDKTRIERDALGEMTIPADKLYGVHTARALENFPISGLRSHPLFIRSLAEVKLACAIANTDLEYLDKRKGMAIQSACREIAEGKNIDQFTLDALQGGAGTSTNMNMNEVIARLAGDDVHPLRDVNMHQSTNDVYPTAVVVTLLKQLRALENDVAKLQDTFQAKEQQFHDVVKLGRTQLQDAVPMTLGQEFGAYAEAIARDRWRIFKCRERIKVINLGGTAIGTGLGAPRKYIFKTTDVLRRITGLNIARGENLVDATQNLDAIAEVSGILKAYAVNLFKIASDLRLLASGPHGGLSEITLPAMQAGSSIMPGKINPVIPEAVSQAALKIMANDSLITHATSLGQLELNQFYPLIAYTMMESLEILQNVSRIFKERCVDGIRANEDSCRENLMKSPLIATVLVPRLGYHKVESLIREAAEKGVSVLDHISESESIPMDELEDLLAPKNMYKLGY